MSTSARCLPLLGLFLSAAVLAGGAVGETGLAPVTDRPFAPDFELPASDGKLVRLADYRGKALIVNFWATWCPPCRAEMPSMQRAWEQVREEGIELIAVNVGEGPEEIQRFAGQLGIGFPLPMDLDSQVVQAWPVVGLPTTFVVDPQGRLVYKAAGERQWDSADLLDQVRALRGPTSPQ